MYEALMDLVSDLIASLGGVGDIHQDLRFQGRSEPCPSMVGIHIRVRECWTLPQGSIGYDFVILQEVPLTPLSPPSSRTCLSRAVSSL